DPSTSDSNKFSTAIDVFHHIATDSIYINTPMAARAWGQLGSCYYKMNGDASTQGITNAALRDVALQRYERASEYFQNAITNAQADVTTRSLAEIRLGQTQAAMAALQPEQRQKLLEDALGYFFSVFYEDNLRDNEQPDASCLKEAGLEAGRLAGEMSDWKQAKQIYQKLLKLMPPLQSAIEKKIAYAEAQENLPAEKK
ncbi:MAG TPA: hypothetical protein VG754_13390, partial [Verrucomicrobiae bacterium]|nr:hypothetical protein [Verrucomicrobiae bacterium]